MGEGPTLRLAVLALVWGCLTGCIDTSPDGKTFRCDPVSGADCKGAGAGSGSTAAAGTAASTGRATSATGDGATGGITGASSSSTSTSSTAGNTGTSGTSGATNTSTGTSGTTGGPMVEIVGTVPGSPAVVDVDVLDDGRVLAVAGNQVFTFDAQGAASVYAGRSQGGEVDGPRLDAGFDGVDGLAHHGNVIYVSELFGNNIRIIDASGYVSSYAGSNSMGSADGAGPVAQFNAPKGMAVDAAGDLLVADTDNDRIRRVSNGASGTTVHTLAGTTRGYADGPALLSAQFSSPHAVSVGTSGEVYVADTENHCIRKIVAGAVSTVGTIVGRPFGVAVDATGTVYASDLDSGTIYRFDSAGTPQVVAHGGAIISPRGIKFDAQGRLLMACGGFNAGNNVVRLTLQ